ncbi:MAG: ATP-binding protein, partial [Candidatus Electrothrix sp. AR4]|nr:ATP-binding protein [Candidatus Electrothrix sp. AR4]
KKIRLKLYQIDHTDKISPPSDKEKQETITLEVTDNGQGMRQEILQKIFGFGFTTKEDGYGFGLHNAANLTAEMRGTLTAESSGPGKGTKFRMQLPVTASGGME